VAKHGHKSLVRRIKINYSGFVYHATMTTMVSRKDKSHETRR
jgi:hypothetical protein